MIYTRAENGIYWIDISAKKSATGKRVRRSTRTTDMKQAKKMEQKLLKKQYYEVTDTTDLAGTGNYTLAPLLAVIRILQEEIDKSIPLSIVITFILTCIAGGEITHKELRTIAGLTDASTSRNISALEKVNRKGREGYDLLKSSYIENSKLRKIARLTPKGWRLYDMIFGAMSVNELNRALLNN